MTHIRKLLFSLSLIIFASTSLFSAEHKSGTLGMGWYSTSAPVGIRVWATPRVGIDLGLGYADKNALGASDSRFHFNLGLPVDLVQTERVNFFIRPGIEIQTNSRQVLTNGTPETKSTLIITADFGAEWFVTDQLSLSVGHGLTFAQTGGNDEWGISALRALSFENVGFHFYF